MNIIDRYDRLQTAIPYALLIAVVLLIYARTAGFDFVLSWDDGSYVVSNPLVTNWSWENLPTIFTTPVMGHYSPLQILSYALEHALWGTNPAGYHLSNTILHAVNSCLVYVLTTRLGTTKRVAFVAALLFAVHPVNVENVAWIAERKTLLSALFFFLAILGYVTWRQRGGAVRFTWSLLCAVLAIMSKSTAVILPLVLVLYEFFFCSSRRWLSVVPFIFLGLGGTYMTLRGHLDADSFESSVLSIEILFGRIYPTAQVIWWKYAGLLLWPVGLNGYYDTVVYDSWWSPTVLLSLTAWVTVWTAMFRWANGTVWFWFLWFWCCFLPVSNIIPINTFYADRYLYTPAIGLYVLAAILIGRCMELAVRRLPRLPGTVYRYQVTVVVLVCLLTVVAYLRVEVWRDELTFWQDTAAKSPNLYKPRLNLGVAYERVGRFNEAAGEYRAATHIWPGGMGQVYLQALQWKQKLPVDTGEHLPSNSVIRTPAKD